MTGNEYQIQVARTMLNTGVPEADTMWLLTGLAEETGEAVAMLRRWAVGKQVVVDPEHLGEELGDVLWYVAAIAKAHGLSLNTIMAYNVAKLRARHPEGY